MFRSYVEMCARIHVRKPRPGRWRRRRGGAKVLVCGQCVCSWRSLAAVLVPLGDTFAVPVQHTPEPRGESGPTLPLARALPAPGANPAGLASAQAESEEGREDTSSRPFSAQIHKPDPGRRLAQRKRRNAPFRCFAFLRQVTVDVCDKRGQLLRAKEHVLLSGRNVVPLGSYAISFKNPFWSCVVPKESVREKNKTLGKYHKLNSNVTAVRVKKSATRRTLLTAS